MEYNELTPHQLVDLLADKRQRYAVIVALLGGITATELRRVKVSDATRQALIDGLKHPNSKVRWWCIQLMDHVADENYVPPLLDAAQPTPRRKIAVTPSTPSPAKFANRSASRSSWKVASLTRLRPLHDWTANSRCANWRCMSLRNCIAKRNSRVVCS